MNSANNNSSTPKTQEYSPVESIRYISNESMGIPDSQSTPSNDFAENDEFCVKQEKSKVNKVSVFDVAKYILEKLDRSITTMKLQKLVYYCQAWYLVWEDEPLYPEKIEAWANGPVVRVLFNFHKGLYRINKNSLTLGNSSKLSQLQKDDIDSVLSFYGNRTSQWLIDQTHSEQPWIKARDGVAPYESSSNEISLQAMTDYYSSLK